MIIVHKNKKGKKYERVDEILAVDAAVSAYREDNRGT